MEHVCDNKKIIVGYHGTKPEYACKIIKVRYFVSSDRNNEWLGKGVYFFIDENKDVAISNAKKWIVDIKKGTFYSIIEALIGVNENELFDLRNEESQKAFHIYRDALVKRFYDERKLVTMDSRALDCAVIDFLCDDLSMLLVIDKRFINFKNNYRGDKVPSSFIPNCTILCVKDHKVIDRDSIRCVEEGRCG